MRMLRCKALSHAAMLHTNDGTSKSPCDDSKSYAMFCDAYSNMLEIWIPILEYLSYLLSYFQTVFSKVMSILWTFM